MKKMQCLIWIYKTSWVALRHIQDKRQLKEAITIYFEAVALLCSIRNTTHFCIIDVRWKFCEINLPRFVGEIYSEKNLHFMDQFSECSAVIYVDINHSIFYR